MAKIARIVNGEIVYSDEHSAAIKPTETEARSSRQSQRDKYRRETLQRNQVGYYKAYPEQAENLSPELRRLLS